MYWGLGFHFFSQFPRHSAPSTQHRSYYRKGRKAKKAKFAKRTLLFLPSTNYPILLYHFHGTLNEIGEFFAFQHVLR